MRILIVDDDAERARSLDAFLSEKQENANLIIAHSGNSQDALRQLSSSYFDVLILDVSLPRRMGDKASPDVGLRLLGDVARSSRYNKPERIIGMTAHLDSLPSFKKKFEEFCLIVVEANRNSTGWRAQISEAINYTSTSKVNRAIRDANIQVITVHGIQTFGGWQKRLKGLCDANIGRMPFYSYKYGVFSIPAFFVPFMRQREVKRLYDFFIGTFDANKNARFVIFCHSFGTYLVAHALRKVCTAREKVPVKLIVTAGSVLRSNFDWKYLRDRGVDLVNDCADNDHVLYLSQALIVGCGMAGKVGFYGAHSEVQVNRFFLGGHSSYFDGDEFMIKHWLPLFSGEAPEEIDLRTATLRHLLVDKIVVGLGTIMPLVYGAITIGLGLYLFSFVKTFSKWG